MQKDERKIGRHHLAFYRGWLQGLDLGELADRYLEDGIDLRVAKSTLRWLQDALSQAALRNGRFGEARLLRISLRHVLNGSVADPGVDGAAATVLPPSIDEFREENDPDGFYSEAELIRLYVEAFPQLIDKKAQRRRRLIDKQLEALRWIENLVTTTPTLDDWVVAWFHKKVADRLLIAKIYTMRDLLDRMRSKGYRWWADVPRLGEKGAERIVTWLKGYEESLGPVPVHATLPPRQVNSLSVIQTRRVSHGIAPMECLDIESMVSDHSIVERNDSGSLIQVRDDREAILQWIESKSGSPHTARSYRKEGERFLLWSLLELGKLLHAVNVDDCVAYRNWLGMLGRTPEHEWPFKISQSDWIGKRNTPRSDENWRPFDGPLSIGSVKQALVILRGMFFWFVQVRYLAFNPWDVVNKKPVRSFSNGVQDQADGRDVGGNDIEDVELSRVLSTSQWNFVLEYVSQMPSSPARERFSFLLLFAYSTGLRLSELVDARIGRLYSKPLPGQLGQRWMLKVLGKGGKVRAVPMSDEVMAALQSYLLSRGLPGALSENDGSTPLISKLTANERLSESALYKILRSLFLQVAEALRAQGLQEDAGSMQKASTHWIRHSRGSHLGLAGVAPSLIQQLLGHSSLATTGIYTQSNEESLYLALAAMDKKSVNAH
ncbi:tyrosine-type recombinase/integrase [Extensimonas soli]|uniref:tyrosine-type recombinase/integrase n=1 Tax=Extensimonas soli TaxID=3031322 RepID=UPI0023D99406|nr:tyrosine-type recombinase/integrase [Extensimonas sp. H3M7-6]MDF1482162.1 tyrosine-type recombinase/integrase [Extensimonas sp. H3M7-6]